MTASADRSLIARLNDQFRQTFIGGKVVMTARIAALPDTEQAQVIEAVRAFSAFTGDNDPNGEHDFGSFAIAGATFLWKIDYYDRDLEYGSEDPADPEVTTRVLTIMTAADY